MLKHVIYDCDRRARLEILKRLLLGVRRVRRPHRRAGPAAGDRASSSYPLSGSTGRIRRASEGTMEGGNPPPQSTVMQMMMAAWAAQTIATVARLGVADVLHDHGPLTAGELIERHRVDARPDMLERALRRARASASSPRPPTAGSGRRRCPTSSSTARRDPSASSSSSSAGAGGRCSAASARRCGPGNRESFRPTPIPAPPRSSGRP